MKNNKNALNVISSEIADNLDAVTCVKCGQVCNADDMYYTVDGDVCEACFDEYAPCDNCHEYVNAYDLVPVYDYWNDITMYVCPSCADDFVACDVCGRLYDDMDALRNGRCEDCRSDLIGEYHAGNPDGIQFHGDTYMSYLNGFIGWELELFGPSDDIAESVHDVAGFEHCHFENDCTVDLEIVGQPRTIENMRDNKRVFRNMFSAIESAGGQSGDLAGLHVHVSRTAFGDTTDEQAERIGRVMTLFSHAHWESMVKLSRRDINSVERWARPMSNDITSNKERAQSIGGTHENAVNLQHSGTVEFRLGRSTISADVFFKWIELIAYIVRKSESMNAKQASDFGAWFYNAPEQIRALIDLKGVNVPPPARVWTMDELKGLVEILCCKAVRSHEFTCGIYGRGEHMNIYDVLTACGLNDGDIAGINPRYLNRD